MNQPPVPASAVPRPEYEILMLALCVYTLGALVLQAVLPEGAPASEILDVADTVVCVAFLADFVISLRRAPSKRGYLLRWGWIDLLSSIPAVHVLRWGRAFRVVRVIRFLRGVRATKIVAGFIVRRRAENTFLAATFVSLLLVILGSVFVLQFERGPDANIKSARDALWWAITTITTVGYGDRYPVTDEGRVVAALLMVAGVGLFGTFSGFVAAWFLAPPAETQESELQAIRREIREIRDLISK